VTQDFPYLTADVAPLAGVYKARPEDFVVVELPAYEACGSGEHLFFEIEKRGLTTHDALARIGRALGLPARAIGCAGLKDQLGITRQVLSVQGVADGVLEQLDVRGLRVLSVRRHKNKLRIGHLRGNRFEIKVRDARANELGALRGVLEVLGRRGVPNYFGEQRFGARGDTWCVGRALLLGDAGEAVAWIAGKPGPRDSGRVLRAREAFDAREFERAADAWPGGYRSCIRLCRAMAKNGGNAKRALHALDRNLLRFYTSAYQSWLFNHVVAERIGEIDRVLEGDLAWLHRNGAVFLVKDVAVDQPRAEQLEISASGPLFGRRMSTPLGRPLEIEREVLRASGHAEEAFARPGPLQWQGARRALRFPLAELELAQGADEFGAFVELKFSLPPGCYATAVLREILKPVAVVADEALASEAAEVSDGDA